jgi:hypothetical protein
MADVFNMDPKVLEGLNKSMSSLSDQAKTGTMNIEHLYNTMRELANLKSKMGAEDVIQIDPTSKKHLSDLIKQMKELGVTKKAFLSMMKEEKGLRDTSIKSVESLSRIEKAALEKKQKALKEEQTTRVRIGKNIVDIGTKQQQQEAAQGPLQKAIVGHLKEQGRELVGLVKNFAASNFSIGFIIAKTIELYNMQRKISGMAQQTAFHWGGGADNIKAAHGEINKLRLQFHISADEAGNFVKDLAKGGVNAAALSRHMGRTQTYMNVLGVEGKKNEIVMKKQAGIGELILANEMQSLMSRGDQHKYMQRIMREENVLSAEGLTVDEARSAKWHNAFTIMRGIQEGAEELRKTGSEITMEEFVSDVSDLRSLQRDYNTELLGTIGLYSTLLGKAKDIKGVVGKDLIEGLGSEETRKGIGKTIAGMGDALSDGWKAAIMGSGVQGIFDFENLEDPQKFKAVGQFIQKNIGGSIETQLLTARKILSPLGFGTRESKKMAEWITTGGGKGEGLNKAVAEMEKMQKEVAARQKQQELGVRSQITSETHLKGILKAFDHLDKNGMKVVGVGEQIATALTPLDQLIREWAEKFFMPMVKYLEILAKWAVGGDVVTSIIEAAGLGEFMSEITGEADFKRKEEIAQGNLQKQRNMYENLSGPFKSFLSESVIAANVLPTMQSGSETGGTGAGTRIANLAQKQVAGHEGTQFGLASRIVLGQELAARGVGTEDLMQVLALAKAGAIKEAASVLSTLLDREKVSGSSTPSSYVQQNAKGP